MYKKVAQWFISVYKNPCKIHKKSAPTERFRPAILLKNISIAGFLRIDFDWRFRAFALKNAYERLLLNVGILILPAQ